MCSHDRIENRQVADLAKYMLAKRSWKSVHVALREAITPQPSYESHAYDFNIKSTDQDLKE